MERSWSAVPSLSPAPTVKTLTLVAVLVACDAAEEPARVVLPVVLDGSAVVPVVTDLGYEVSLTRARIAVEDFTFAVGGEAHVADSPFSNLFVSVAHAHPGHYEGGDITGEMPGVFLLDWSKDSSAKLGTATLLVGAYESAGFKFTTATSALGLDEDDPLLGHTALLEGTVNRGSFELALVALIDSPMDRELLGVPFEAQITVADETELRLRLSTDNPFEVGTLFDGIDFETLEPTEPGLITLQPSSTSTDLTDAYNQLRRTLQTHNHYRIHAQLL